MRRVSILLLGGLFALYTASASAVDFPNGTYWGINGGISEERDFCDDRPPPMPFDEQAGCDDSDFAWNVFMGYQFMKWLSVEGGYADLGGSELRVVQDSITTKTKGWTLGGVFTIPWLERAGLYGSAGAFFWDRDSRVFGVGGTGGSQSDTGTDYYFGIGLRYPFSEKVGVSIDFKNYVDVGSSDVGNSDIYVYSLGLLFRF